MPCTSGLDVAAQILCRQFTLPAFQLNLCSDGQTKVKILPRQGLPKAFLALEKSADPTCEFQEASATPSTLILSRLGALPEWLCRKGQSEGGGR
eukprot:5119380-Pyramimonas_sp.AAC.1